MVDYYYDECNVGKWLAEQVEKLMKRIGTSISQFSMQAWNNISFENEITISPLNESNLKQCKAIENIEAFNDAVRAFDKNCHQAKILETLAL